MESASKDKSPTSGIIAAIATPLFLGVAPIFGKLAVEADVDPFTVAALRTIIAVVFLWVGYSLFARRYIYIYTAGLMGCVVIGAINGIGSLFFYGGLSLLDASLAQLINGTNLVFAVLLTHIGGQRSDRRTVFRVALTLAALVFITSIGVSGGVNWTGVGLMLGNALMFAGTVVLSQYVLYEMPSQTAALYILTTMAVVVTMVWLAVSPPLSETSVQSAMVWIVFLGITTALSRLAMFAGVKFLGGMQTAILAAAEIGVTLLLAFVFLGDTLTFFQWIGVGLLISSILLVRQKDLLPHGFNPNQLIVANMASVQFQRIAFHRAFGTSDHDNSEGTMGALTTQELIAIQQMMGAEVGGIDPYPIGKTRGVPLDDPFDSPMRPSSMAPPAMPAKKQAGTEPPNKTVITQEIKIPSDFDEDDESSSEG